MSAVSRGDLERTRSWLAAAFSEPPVAEVVGCLSPAYPALALLEIATDMEVALDSLRRGTEAAEASNQPFDTVVLLALQATFSALVGREKAGHQLSEAAVVAARALGNPTALAIATYIWATAHWMDDPAAARAALEESVALTESGASDVIYGDTQELLARLEFLAGDVSRAANLEGALDCSTSVGNRPSVVGHLWYAGEIAGNFGIEAEFTAVTHGIHAQRRDAGDVPSRGSRPRDIHESALDPRDRARTRPLRGAVRAGRPDELRSRWSDCAGRELDRIIAEVDTLDEQDPS